MAYDFYWYVDNSRISESKGNKGYNINFNTKFILKFYATKFVLIGKNTESKNVV